MEKQREKTIFFMNKALELGKKAFDEGEVPVGALIVKNGEILATGYNNRENKQNPFGHAEMETIKKAAEKLNSWRLEGCELYVTLEPCLMCIGACLQTRISQLVYGCKDPKGGFDTFYKLRSSPHWKSPFHIIEGVEEEKSSQLLKSFFKKLREKEKSFSLKSN